MRSPSGVMSIRTWMGQHDPAPSMVSRADGSDGRRWRGLSLRGTGFRILQALAIRDKPRRGGSRASLRAVAGPLSRVSRPPRARCSGRTSLRPKSCLEPPSWPKAVPPEGLRSRDDVRRGHWRSEDNLRCRASVQGLVVLIQPHQEEERHHGGRGMRRGPPFRERRRGAATEICQHAQSGSGAHCGRHGSRLRMSLNATAPRVASAS